MIVCFKCACIQHTLHILIEIVCGGAVLWHLARVNLTFLVERAFRMLLLPIERQHTHTRTRNQQSVRVYTKRSSVFGYWTRSFSANAFVSCDNCQHAEALNRSVTIGENKFFLEFVQISVVFFYINKFVHRLNRRNGAHCMVKLIQNQHHSHNCIGNWIRLHRSAHTYSKQ